MKSNLQINNEVKILQKENEELKTRLSINNKIIQEFFKTSNMNEKVSIFVDNIKKENNILQNEISELKKHNQELITKIENISNPNKTNIETYENKLFIYENLLKEKQSIIVNLKEQNKTLNNFIESNINKKEIPNTNNNIENMENEKDTNNKQNTKYIIEEIYVISPEKIINTLNDKIELYKDINIKLKNLLQEMKSRLLTKGQDYLKLEEELSNLKQELQKQTQIKNNEEIMTQLIQYQSMKSIPTSQSCSNFNINTNNINNILKNKNTRNKKIRSLSYINPHTDNLSKVMKEIEVYENVNKTVKEISKNDFDLAGEWAETLKQCGMTQEEFVRFCGMKITNKLTNAIEYMYKILIDKNIQIKLLTKENETLNEENIRLNKINIQMESMIDYYEKNKKNNLINDNNKVNIKDINIYENITNYNDLNKNQKNKNIKCNTFFKEAKLKDKNSLSQNKHQKTYVNVDNNITNTNININMMMDYNNQNDTSKNIRNDLIKKNNNTSYENMNNKKDEFKKFQTFDYMSKIRHKCKSNNKIYKYIKLRNKKISNNSYNKLIKEKKNVLAFKTLNLTAIKRKKFNNEKFNNNSFNYNKTIKSIFSNTEKILLKNKERNTVMIPNNKNNKILDINNFFTDIKLGNKHKKKINIIHTDNK